MCVHQFCSVEGNDLNHLVKGNQADLFRSMVFERITRPYPLPPSYTIIFYIPNIKALALVISDKRDSFIFSLDASVKHVTPGQADFVTQGQNFKILGRSQLGDVTKQISIKACFVVSEKIFSCLPYIILYKICDPAAGPFLTPGHYLNKLGRDSLGDA